ncbi:chitin-binding protein [Kibdelosporangium banguiense]|uniref:Chitin-binding protein n=1 Tax=Kibdelosporangium banguiense TaxID=1365924 RepID=A0ABS4T765_9PSEU|nr:polysaccharide lyase [Kibdelosporangium banguiense]MBP2320238.1 chitin-binding protein [Kibdelosporangium banguiense]
MSSAGIGRRQALFLPVAAFALPSAGWQLRWSPVPGKDGLGAFEGVEDDRANSHPGVKHIYAQGNTYRFDMHKRDRDTATDRQRNEVRGMRTGGNALDMDNGQTWRFTYSMFIPSTLKATGSFTHIMQTKMPGLGSAPITVMSLRRQGNTPTIEFRVTEGDTLVGRTDLAPLQDRWISTEVEIKIGNAGEGHVAWLIRNGETTVLDVRKSGVDTWLDDRVRPKWGIYRSLSDSAQIQDCHLLLRDLRAYQLM